MAQFYCVFIVVFTVMFPYIAHSQEYLNLNGSHKGVVLSNVENHCQKWYNPSSGNNNSRYLDRDLSLSIIFVRLINSSETSIGLEENAQSPGKYISTSAEGEKKTVTVEIQCKSPYPVSMIITWGENHENVDDTLDRNRKPIKNSLQNPLLASTVIQISLYKTPLPVRVVCLQKSVANVVHNYQSQFDFFLVCQGKLEINPIVENNAYYTMASYLALAACLPMVPFQQEDNLGFVIQIVTVALGICLVFCLIGGYVWRPIYKIISNITGRGNASIQWQRRPNSLPILPDVVRNRDPGPVIEFLV